jgi:hypothetical protein
MEQELRWKTKKNVGNKKVYQIFVSVPVLLSGLTETLWAYCYATNSSLMA